MSLVDTPLLVELRKGHLANPAAFDWAFTQDLTECFVSSVSLAEIDRAIVAREKQSPREGGVLREWFEERLLPAFAGRILDFGGGRGGRR